MINRTDLINAIPDTTATIKLDGLISSVEIYRDQYGIPHVRAENLEDAFFGQGFVTAQDRLWHMDYDRHRAYGRWAELIGHEGLEQDLVMRRFRLEHSAKSDYRAVNHETKTMLESYAAGVNAFIDYSDRFPIEYKLLGCKPEQWQAWDGLAVFKVRHILMGTFEGKSWRVRLLNTLGAKQTARLHPGYQSGHLLIIPPGEEYTGSVTDALEALEKGATIIDHLKDLDQGSNHWTLSGTRTGSGKPILAGDPHRGLDTPNVYYQNHITCPDFDVIGISFPGVPGFPHFGHNQWVCWGVTHGMADYQDLYVEKFNPEHPDYYRFKGEWKRTEVYREIIKVRGSSSTEIDVNVTHHGPIISGDPSSGFGVAFRYTQTFEANRSAECLVKMLLAKSTFDLDESMRQWVDPVNNFLFSDVNGNIGYLTRGLLPVRSQTNAWLPVPGWTGAHEWEGFIPFKELPRSHNPKSGYIVTANQKIVGEDYPYYISLDYAPEFRAKRITLRIKNLKEATVEDMAAVHADRISIPAQHYLRHLATLHVNDEGSKASLAILQGWNGDTDRDSVATTIYEAFRIHLDRRVLQHLFGNLANSALIETNRGGPAHAARLRAHLIQMLDSNDNSLLPPGTDWISLLTDSLKEATEELTSLLGTDLSQWKWGKIHHTSPQHPLSILFPESAVLLNPPQVPLGGDGDTVQAAAYSPAQPYAITSTSVLRYVYDLDNWNNSRWIIPLGSSGHPGSTHYADQATIWSEVGYIPMLYEWDGIISNSESHQVLNPS